MKRHHWKIWNDADEVLCEGSRAKCLQFYKRNGGSKAGLHLGYDI